LKSAGVPQTTGSISAASGPKFTILWGHVEDILLLNKFFSTAEIRRGKKEEEERTNDRMKM